MYINSILKMSNQLYAKSSFCIFSIFFNEELSFDHIIIAETSCTYINTYEVPPIPCRHFGLNAEYGSDVLFVSCIVISVNLPNTPASSKDCTAMSDCFSVKL